MSDRLFTNISSQPAVISDCDLQQMGSNLVAVGFLALRLGAQINAGRHFAAVRLALHSTTRLVTR